MGHAELYYLLTVKLLHFWYAVHCQRLVTRWNVLVKKYSSFTEAWEEVNLKIFGLFLIKTPTPMFMSNYVGGLSSIVDEQKIWSFMLVNASI